MGNLIEGTCTREDGEEVDHRTWAVVHVEMPNGTWSSRIRVPENTGDEEIIRDTVVQMVRQGHQPEQAVVNIYRFKTEEESQQAYDALPGDEETLVSREEQPMERDLAILLALMGSNKI